MYPTLTHLIEDLTGFHLPMPIQTFGFMMALSFIAAAATLRSELKRKRLLGLIPTAVRTRVVGKPASAADLVISFAAGFIVGFKLVDLVFHYPQFAENPQAYLLSLNGSLPAGLLVGLLMAGWKYYEKKKAQLPAPKTETMQLMPEDLVWDITVVAAATSLVGAKIFDNLENWDMFISDPIGSLFSFSGLTFYGGLIFGFVGVLWYTSRYGIRPAVLCDAAAPGVMLGYGIGRIGCQLSGDGDWGIVNTNSKPSFLPEWAWASTYPHNVIGEGIQIPGCVGKFCTELPQPVYPTPLYEVIMALAIFGFLWAIRKRIRIPGMLFSIYLLLNGIERFLIESIRVNSLYHLFGIAFTQAQLISSALIVTGLIGIFTLRQRPNLFAGTPSTKA
jgi:phosphatidylglycerol---prolipoprotein diacylglyceryl transferase